MFEKDHRGIVGPISNAASHQSIPDHKGRNKQTAVNDLPQGWTAENMNEFCEKEALHGFYLEVPLVHGFCFAVRRQVIEKLGPFDEELFPHGYGEENDYCLRATNAGFSLALATNTYIFHSKSKSYDSKKRAELVAAGLKNLFARHTQKRVNRSVVSIEQNPFLINLRKKSSEHYQ